MLYVGHYPIDTYVDIHDYLRDKASPHSLIHGNGVSSRRVATAITGTTNSKLMVLLETLISETPPATLRYIVDIIPMPIPQANAFKYYVTSLPDSYLWIIWDGPPGQVALPPRYLGVLVTLEEQPGHIALREDVGKPPPLESYKPPHESTPIHLPPTARAGREGGGGGDRNIEGTNGGDESIRPDGDGLENLSRRPG